MRASLYRPSARLFLILALIWLAANSCVAAMAAEPLGRVTQSLQVLYTFESVEGSIVHDRSGVMPPLDLRIEDSSHVERGKTHLAIRAPVTIRSVEPATKVIDAIGQSGTVTVEAWIRPANQSQNGPARIVSISSDTSTRNLTLGQDANQFNVRLRTTAASNNGLPAVVTDPGSAATDLTHVVYTRAADGGVSLYVNGRSQEILGAKGDLSNWAGDYKLILANEQTGDRPWLGEMHLVAIYSRALTAAEVNRNHTAGVPAAIDVSKLPPPIDRKIDFVADVQPIFRKHCFECHSEGNEEGALNLGVRARVLEGGEHGAVFTAGNSAASSLIHRVAALDEDTVMPPDGERLTAAQVGILRAWIDQGATWPAGVDVHDARAEKAMSHWAYQPLKPVEAADASVDSSTIDRSIATRLAEAGLTPSPPADPRTLIRRMYFDVIGLPPTPEEVETFVSAAQRDRKQAVAELVDRLLASRHYGERWGRHWLDVARYADSSGQEGDQDRDHAWHYRDFVIRALNDDMPFDQFVRWQLAGDEYEPQNAAAVAATGFLTAGPNTELADTFLEEERLRNRYNELDDMVSTIGTSLLGMTIGCARCHDHKYDAISAREYYRMLAAVHSGDRAEVTVGGEGTKLLAFRDFGSEPATTWLFERSDFYDRDQQVRLGFLNVLMRGRTADDYWNEAREAASNSASTHQRQALARWITDVEQGAGPLLARVIVNRLWQHHFGAGLVRTVDDFGVRGEEPTHPELLESLANDLVAGGWKLKRVHRMILLSDTYQQSAAFHAEAAKVDPENRLLWRMKPQRLEAEIIRDAMLAVSGELNLQPYGPSFKPPIAREANVARNLKSPYPDKVEDGPDNHRRTVYMFHKRVVPYPLLQAFDRPDLLQACGRRENTTVAPQALAMLNDAFVRQRAVAFADRVIALAGNDPSVLATRAFELAVSRPPSETERSAATAFVQQQIASRRARGGKTKPPEIQRQAVADYCQVLLGLNEFVYVD